MKTVEIRSLKYNRQPHLFWDAALIESTNRRVACIAHPGTRCKHYSKGIEFTIEHYTMAIFERGSWYNIMVDFTPTGDFESLYCNVATPPEEFDGGVEWVDLDLDFVVTPGSRSAEVVDVDEFKQNSVRFSYPADVVGQAYRAVDELWERFRSNEEPFRGSRLEVVWRNLFSTDAPQPINWVPAGKDDM